MIGAHPHRDSFRRSAMAMQARRAAASACLHVSEGSRGARGTGEVMGAHRLHRGRQKPFLAPCGSLLPQILGGCGLARRYRSRQQSEDSPSRRRRAGGCRRSRSGPELVAILARLRQPDRAAIQDPGEVLAVDVGELLEQRSEVVGNRRPGPDLGRSRSSGRSSGWWPSDVLRGVGAAPAASSKTRRRYFGVTPAADRDPENIRAHRGHRDARAACAISRVMSSTASMSTSAGSTRAPRTHAHQRCGAQVSRSSADASLLLQVSIPAGVIAPGVEAVAGRIVRRDQPRLKAPSIPSHRPVPGSPYGRRSPQRRGCRRGRAADCGCACPRPRSA